MDGGSVGPGREFRKALLRETKHRSLVPFHYQCSSYPKHTHHNALLPDPTKQRMVVHGWCAAQVSLNVATPRSTYASMFQSFRSCKPSDPLGTVPIHPNYWLRLRPAPLPRERIVRGNQSAATYKYTAKRVKIGKLRMQHIDVVARVYIVRETYKDLQTITTCCLIVVSSSWHWMMEKLRKGLQETPRG